MMDAPSGIFGIGKSRDVLLATQTLAFESNARARTLIPHRKVSALEGSSTGKRTTVSDWELLTQTRFCGSMTMSKGDFNPATLTIRPVLHVSTGEMEQLITGAVGNPDVTVRGDTDAHQSEEFLLEGEVALAWRRDDPRNPSRGTCPLKLDAQTCSRVTAVPQPTPSMPMPVKPVIGGESALAVGA